MSELAKAIEELEAGGAVRFSRLIAICTRYFGAPRKRGSHHIFRMPWPGDPRINLQEAKGGLAKPYQVRQTIQALRRLMEQSDDDGG